MREGGGEVKKVKRCLKEVAQRFRVTRGLENNRRVPQFEFLGENQRLFRKSLRKIQHFLCKSIERKRIL